MKTTRTLLVPMCMVIALAGCVGQVEKITPPIPVKPVDPKPVDPVEHTTTARLSAQMARATVTCFMTQKYRTDRPPKSLSHDQ